VSTRNNPLAERNRPVLCYVTDRRSLSEAKPLGSVTMLAKKIEQIIAAGVDWVQVREKDLPAAELASLTRQSLRIAANLSARSSSPTRIFVRILVNDRLDVAIAERAGGVHLGEKGLPVAEAKRLVNSAQRRQALDDSFLIGASCHSLEAAQAAQRDGADYIFFGPIFATPSKASFGAPQGTERLEQVCRALSIPVLAIGGITLDNANSCIHAGAAGVAAIRLLQDALDPAGAIQRLRRTAQLPPPTTCGS
jgi:thiamine-phosphate pyrophosphorylase